VRACATPSATDEGTTWPQDVVLMQVGWHWKVDAFDVVDEPLATE
jgi:hypothetical protein